MFLALFYTIKKMYLELYGELWLRKIIMIIFNDYIQEHPKDLKHDKYIDKEKEQENDLILTPIKDRLDEEFKKNW